MSLGRAGTGGREKDSHRRREDGAAGAFQGSLGSCFCPGQSLPAASSKRLGRHESRAPLWTWSWDLRQVRSPMGCGCSVSGGTGAVEAGHLRVPEMPGASSSCGPSLAWQEETLCRERSRLPRITDPRLGRAWDPRASLRAPPLRLENWNSCRGASWAPRGAKPGERSRQAPLWPEPPQGRGRCCCGERGREGGEREEGKQ